MQRWIASMSSADPLDELEARLAELQRAIIRGWVERAKELRATVARLAAGDTSARREVQRLGHRLRGVLDERYPDMNEQAARVELGLESDAELIEAALVLATMLERSRTDTVSGEQGDATLEHGRSARDAERRDVHASDARREDAATATAQATTTSEASGERVSDPPSDRPSGPPTVTLRKRVIALDDDPATRRLLTITLTRVGECEAHVVGQAAEAFELARSGAVDLVLVDAMMPDVTGLELYRALRHELGPSLPIAFLSGARLSDLGWNLPEDRRLTWLRKPFRPAQLIEQLAAFLERAG
jgi:CheY-like chemotaxis protein